MLPLLRIYVLVSTVHQWLPIRWLSSRHIMSIFLQIIIFLSVLQLSWRDNLALLYDFWWFLPHRLLLLLRLDLRRSSLDHRLCITLGFLSVPKQSLPLLFNFPFVFFLHMLLVTIELLINSLVMRHSWASFEGAHVRGCDWWCVRIDRWCVWISAISTWSRRIHRHSLHIILSLLLSL